jgi:hypothetical protein
LRAVVLHLLQDAGNIAAQAAGLSFTTGREAKRYTGHKGEPKVHAGRNP